MEARDYSWREWRLRPLVIFAVTFTGLMRRLYLCLSVEKDPVGPREATKRLRSHK
jgi:hypothetical protein